MESLGKLKVIDGQYQILRRLGAGLTGEVYHVRRGTEEWALKLLRAVPPEEIDPEGWVAAFKFEFSLLKDIRHPHIVKIGDFGWDRELGRLYFTQELIDGVPLNHFLQDHDPKMAEVLFMQCLEGLEAIHQAQALHGDIKPSNILVTGTRDTPRAIILDLGVSHPRFRSGSGTPSYIAPEKVLGDAVDRRSDLYSLAVVFYEVVTGINPFTRKSVAEGFKAQTSVIPAPPGSLNPKIPPYFNRILQQLLSKNPRDRPATAGTVLNEIRAARSEPSHRDDSLPIVTERWVGRPKVLDGIRNWARGLKEGTDFSLFVVSGGSGVGKTRLLQEMRYDLELAGHSIGIVRSEDLGTPARQVAGDIWLLDMESADGLEPFLSAIKGHVRGLLVAVSDRHAAPAVAAASMLSIPCVTEVLTGFTPEDIRQIVEWSSQDLNPPALLVNNLYDETKGHPARTVHLLTALCEQKKLIDPEGHWNLAIFRENGIDLGEILTSRQVVDDYLSSVGEDRPEERTILLLAKLKEKLRENDRESLDPLFQETERVLKKLSGEKRLHQRLELLERKAWSALQEGNLEKASAEIAAAKVLEEEATSPDPALHLRLMNFGAFVALKSGRVDEAIRLFQETYLAWKDLPGDRQALVVNNDLGEALMQKGRHAEAIAVLTDFLQFFEERGNDLDQIRSHYQLGECCYQLKSHQEALEHYGAVETGARRLRKWDFLLRAYNGLGNVLNLLDRPREGIDYYRRALDLARYLEDYSAAAAVAQNIGVIEKDLGQETAAGHHLDLSLKLLGQIREKTPYILSLEARATLESGALARERRDFDRARERLNEAKRLIAAHPSLESFAFFVFRNLAQLALDQNRSEEFCALYPDLLFHAKTEEQKKVVEELRKRSTVDPTQAQLQPSGQTVPAVPKRAVEPSTDWVRALLEINQFLNSERNLPNLLGLVLKYALSLSSAEGGVILLADDSGRLSLGASLNIAADEGFSQVSRSVAERVLKEGRSVRADNAVEDKDFQEYRSVMMLGLKSIYCAPIRAQKKIVGVLYLIHRFQTSLFHEGTEVVLTAFADQAGLAIENARLIQAIGEQNRSLKGEMEEASARLESYESLLRERDRDRRYAYPEIVSKSPAMEKVFHLLDRITSSNLSVLIQGETGTGKELVARALHQNGTRRKGKFVAINCGALPANLIESELFGYRAGAFTGAARDKRGLLEEAGGGTLFLDEIGDLEVALQVKLLRALQERTILRLGETSPVTIDVRVVTATHRDLRQSIIDGSFREDLFYRIAEIQIDLPSLRERREDIPLLVDYFVKNYCRETGLKPAPRISRELMTAFLSYPWPGNIRELANRVRVACALSEGKVLKLHDLPESDQKILTSTSGPKSHQPAGASAVKTSPSFFRDILESGKSWREIENIIFAKALFHCDFDVGKASAALGVSPATLYNRLRREKYLQRRALFEGYAYSYPGGVTLGEIKKRVFRLACELSDDKPYHAARRLGVSAGMLYRWTGDRDKTSTHRSPPG